MKFRLLIDYEVIEFMERLPRREQLALRRLFIFVQDYPGKFSDYTESDIQGRRVDVHIFGKYVIKFWADHADQHVKILNLDFADSSKG